MHSLGQSHTHIASHDQVCTGGCALTNSCRQASLHVQSASRGACVSPAASAAFSAVQLHLPAAACDGLLTSPVTPDSCGRVENFDHAVCCLQAPSSLASLPFLLAAVAQDGKPALHAVACKHA